MEVIAENKLFKHIVGVSVCAQPVRPVQLIGQTSLHDLHGTMRLDQPVRLVGKTGQAGHLSETKLHSQISVTNP